jgi:hypothetical protein
MRPILVLLASFFCLLSCEGDSPRDNDDSDASSDSREPKKSSKPIAPIVSLEECNITTRVDEGQRPGRSKESLVLQIDRIAGCHGDTETARARVLPSVGILAEPTYDVNSYEPGILYMDTIGDAACVIDDEPDGMIEFTQSVMEYSSYLATEVFSCGCGTCWAEDYNIDFGEDELEDRATKTHRTQFEEYEAQRTEEVATQKKIHDEYSEDYETWSHRRERKLRDPSIRITIIATSDIPAGLLQAYSYRWNEYSWCGDIQDADREEFIQRRIEHPAIPAGHTLEVWLENVDLDLAWGVIMNDDPEGLDRDILDLQAEAPKQAERGRTPTREIPRQLRGRTVETGEGTSADIGDDCCGC